MSNSQQAAQSVAQLIGQSLGTISPGTELATVVDISYQATYGYVVATNGKGPVQVYGCPNASVIPGMGILIRPISTYGVARYIFDGVSLNSLKGSGSSLMHNDFTTMQNSEAARGLAHTGILDPLSFIDPYWSNTTVGTTVPANSYLTGWYWSFFFMISKPPVPGAYISLMTTGALVDEGFTGLLFLSPRVDIVYDWHGCVGLWITNDPFSDPAVRTYTTQTFAPGRIWFLQVQIGNGLSMNGVPVTPPSNISALPIPLTGKIVHGFMGHSDFNGFSAPTNKPPLGSWISKMQFGYYAPILGTLTLPYAIYGFIPTKDTQILNGNATLGTGLTTYDRFLVSDGSGSTLPNTGLSSEPATLLYPSALIPIGPYLS